MMYSPIVLEDYMSIRRIDGPAYDYEVTYDGVILRMDFEDIKALYNAASEVERSRNDK